MSLNKNKSFLSILIVLLVILFVSVALNVYLIKGGKKITKYHIAAAEKIIRLKFSSSERKMMIDDLKQNRTKYQRMRNFALDNSVSPAIQFDPVISDLTLDRSASSFKIADYPSTRVPENLEDVAFYPIPRLAQLIRSRQVTATQLTEMYLSRLKKYGPKLKCIVTLTEDLALKQAQKADEEIAAGQYRGLLHGIPYGVKDLLSTKGIKTTWGAAPYKDQMIDEDATVVKKLEDAGAILVAKLTLGALAMGDVWYGGKTRNPWNIERGSSGSSAGPAAAVAAGLVPFAIGSETWGSIVSPSTVCGVTGLRPTFGRVSRYGAMALSWSMDKLGPLCRTVEDCAIVLQAIHGPDGKDQTVKDLPFHYNPDIQLQDLKIGYLKSDFESDYGFRKNDSLALEKMRSLGAELIPLKLPDVQARNISFILSAEAAAAFDELIRSDKDDLLVRQDRDAWPNTFRTARFIPAVEYINANRVRTVLMQKMAEMMNEIDLYVAPSWKGQNLLMTNLTGHPSVVMPNGFSERGTPTSFCFVGQLFDEGTLLAAARIFQENTDFHLQHPKMEWVNEDK